MKLLTSAQDYIEKHGVAMSSEQLFVQFQHMIECHAEFEKHLKETHINEKLEKMQRSKRLLEKRKLFTEWYVKKYQNTKMVKEILIDLSEITFTSTKTIKNVLSRETTGS